MVGICDEDENCVVAVEKMMTLDDGEVLVIGRAFSTSPLFLKPYDSRSIGVLRCKFGESLPVQDMWKFSSVTVKYFPLPLKVRSGRYDLFELDQDWVMTALKHCE